jgi:hypothetical protein
MMMQILKKSFYFVLLLNIAAPMILICSGCLNVLGLIGGSNSKETEQVAAALDRKNVRPRTWHAGYDKFRGELISATNTQATIKKEDGTIFIVDRDSLSAVDRDYVTKMMLGDSLGDSRSWVDEEQTVINLLVDEYERDPERFDRETEQITRDYYSVKAEEALLREQYGISEVEWRESLRELIRGRSLSEPLHNKDIVEHILRRRQMAR